MSNPNIPVCEKCHNNHFEDQSCADALRETSPRDGYALTLQRIKDTPSCWLGGVLAEVVRECLRRKFFKDADWLQQFVRRVTEDPRSYEVQTPKTTMPTDNKLTAASSVQRLVRPIPSQLHEYIARITFAHDSSLSAGLCGAHEGCEHYKGQMQQLIAELASWSGLEGELRSGKSGMGNIKFNGTPLEWPK